MRTVPYKIMRRFYMLMRRTTISHFSKKSPPQEMSHGGIDFYSPYIAQPVPIRGREDEDHHIRSDGERNACL